MVLGPARSGKSLWAEHLARQSGLPVTYVATGLQPTFADPKWQERVDIHRSRRPAHWQVQEVGFELDSALASLPPQICALVDSLGSWVAWGLELDDGSWLNHCQELLNTVSNSRAELVLVSEQAGWGVVPPTAIGGLFRDRLGGLEQQLVERAQQSWLVVAGRALDLDTHTFVVPRS
ncbi:bifunctional adenosylcobinamide kinase/adenosylcobinamide-phosphate guanylyltransferase [Cyanobium sp. HWJ4-Hawea]|uniref:bifunctional adenosylcobinamide kinase/adenosylcobinamide-phosphate guanylyltransferase n=1 Tax=Cyanobium sp. HWJ4-Hawea TaxID=2823713 RepID=UPI0020CF58FF|nr:bifunctional adenosylcobinamide kinase/adenosylcobinamide-phosphate guanylyltransferase [Cyanobium sp. HWJ4-Hawea]MCP9809089.1 bifunctional adenosylcobinamide kinase/adenosylcobinamide-phosphate guanylyltransferase [Cyanobium sp. HWJ4-Hawea]